MSADEQQITHPGPILRAARDELRLSVEEVADRLHLRPSVVALIESETYDDFSSDVFLRGYFRSYCRLVGLHEQRMVELLDRQLAVIREEQRVSAKKQADAEVRAKRLHIAKLSAVVIVILLVCVGIIWNVSNPSTFPDGSGNTSSDKVSVNVSDDAVSDGLGVENVPDEQLEIVVLDAEKSSAAELLGLQNSSGEDLALDSMASDSVQVTSNADDLASVSTIEEGPAVTIKLQFSDECWFEAFGANGEAIRTGLMKANDVYQYQGATPIRLVLGNGEAAVLEVDGAPYDFSSRIRKSKRAEIILE